MEEQTTEKKVKVNKKKTAKILVFLVIAVILVISIIVTLNVIQGKQKTIDELGNLSNMGFAASGEDAIYYNKYEEGIVKVKGSEEMQITNENACAINVVGDTIYYLSIADASNISIKSVSSNGSNLTTIKTVKTSISKIYVEGDYIYYATNGSNEGIAKLTLDGSEETMLTNSDITDFEVIDGEVYFSNDIGVLYKMTVDGEDFKTIETDYDIEEFQVKDDWVYYYNEENTNLCKVSVEGGDEVVVSEYVNSNIYNIAKKKIYFYNSESKMIASIDFDGGNYKEIVSVSTNKTKISVVDNMIYYLDAAEDTSKIYQMYRVKTNGGTAKEIEY